MTQSTHQFETLALHGGSWRADPATGAGRRFVNALKLFYHVANIGDARSLAIFPRPRRTRSFLPKSSLRPASQLATCGCLSASSIQTTSLPLASALDSAAIGGEPVRTAA
jgi:hypothetical protein